MDMDHSGLRGGDGELEMNELLPLSKSIGRFGQSRSAYAFAFARSAFTRQSERVGDPKASADVARSSTHGQMTHRGREHPGALGQAVSK